MSSSSSSTSTSFLSSSSSSGLSSTETLSAEALQTLPPMTHEVESPMPDSVRVDDPDAIIDRSIPTEDLSHHSGLYWVNPKVIGYTSLFTNSSFISSFVDKFSLFKLDVADGILAMYRSTSFRDSFFLCLLFLLF